MYLEEDTNLTIHLAQDSSSFDVDRLVFLLMELDKVHNQASPEKFPLFAMEKRREDILKILDQGYLFYAKIHNQIVAFASVLKKKDALIIEYLFVLPEYRHKKIGTKLVKNIFAKFPNQEIFVSVYAFNEEAIKFYEPLFALSSLVFKKK